MTTYRIDLSDRWSVSVINRYESIGVVKVLTAFVGE